MAKRTAVLVTGSRDWTDYDAIRNRLALYPGGAILLHGDCGKPEHYDFMGEVLAWRGADKIAADIAQLGRFIVWPLPYFADLKKRGGPARNEAMWRVLLTLRDAGFDCYVEAFPMGGPGTRDMLRRVKEYNEAAFCDSARTKKHHDPMPVCVTEGKRG